MKDKISFKTIFAYSIGSVGDSAAYNMVISFFSFYMTTVQGVSPAITGTVTMLAILWDAITDPWVGYRLDNSLRKEKRRSFIGMSVLPLSLSVIMMFMNMGFMGDMKIVYYLISVLIFWTAYTVFNIPYYSLGGTLSDNDDDRTKLASYREVAGFIGILAGTSVPTFLVGYFKDLGISTETSWMYAAFAVSLITLVSITLMWYLTKGEEHSEYSEEHAAPEKMSFRGLLENLKELFQIKPYVLIVLSALFFNVFLTLFYGVIMYFATFVLEISETDASMLFTVMNIWGIVCIPFIAKAAMNRDKKKIYTTTIMFSGLVMVLGFFIPMNYATSIAFVMLANIGTAAYWMFIFMLVYDVVDIDEFKNDKKRDGLIVSVYSFLLKAGGAVTTQILGFVLVWGGFDADAAVQTPQAITIIKALFTLAPGIFLLLSGYMIVKSPATKEKMDKLKEALKLKHENKEVDTSGFEELL